MTNFLIALAGAVGIYAVYLHWKMKTAEALKEHEEAQKVINEIDSKIKSNDDALKSEEEKQKELEEKIKNE